MPGYDEKKPDRLKPAAAWMSLSQSGLSETADRGSCSEAVVSEPPFRNRCFGAAFQKLLIRNSICRVKAVRQK